MALTDLTRISTSGIATGSTIDAPILRKDVSFHGSQVGVTSALFDSSENELNFKDNVELTFGDKSGGDLILKHDGSHNRITSTNGFLAIANTADLVSIDGANRIDISDDFIRLRSRDGSDVYMTGTVNSSVDLYFNGSERIRTTNDGAFVTGILTATSFSGPTNNTSGIATFYDLRVSNNLTVEGTTTTLDTNLIGVDRVEVGADSNTVVGVAITQSGTADILNLYDGATNVLTVTDTGDVGIRKPVPGTSLHVRSTATGGGNIAYFDDTGSGATGRLMILTTGGASTDGVKLQTVNRKYTHFGSGTSTLTIDNNNQRVGIGTDNPNNPLTIHGSGNHIYLKDTATNNILQIRHSGGVAEFNSFDLDGSARRDFVFNQYATEVLRINSSGNVGVNTDFTGSQTWRNGQKLEIFGGGGNVTGELHLGANRGDSNQSVGSINFFDNTQDSTHRHIALIEADKTGSTSNKRGGALIFFTKNDNVAAPTEKLRIESGGGLKFTGQGTSIPVGGILHHTNNNLYVRGGTNGLILGNDNNYTTIQIYDTYMKFETNDGTEKLRITSTGKVGIGTNNPLGTLSLIADDSQSHADIVFQTKGGTSLAHAALSTTDDTGGTDVMLGANLYLSTNGTQTRYNTGRSGSAVQFGYSGTIRFYNNNSNNAPTERLRITSEGQLRNQGTYNGSSSTSNDFPCININNLQGSYTANNIIGGVTFGKAPGHSSGIRAGILASYSDTGSDSSNIGTYLVFRTAGNTAGDSQERLRIDKDGRLIQRYSSTPYVNRAATFQSPAGQGQTYVAIVNTETNGSCGVLFGDHAGQNAGNYDGYINYNHQYQHLQFMVGSGTERVRIEPNSGIGKVTIQGEAHGGTVYGLEIIGNQQTNAVSGADAGARIIAPVARRMYFELRANDDSDHFGWLGNPDYDTGVADTVMMLLDAKGRLTTPLQPSFMANFGGNNNVSHDNGDYLKANNTDHNTGNCYNTSNYRFTAPVAGNYLFYGRANMSGVTTNDYSRSYQVRLFKNNSSEQFHMARTTITGYSGSYPDTSTMVCSINLAANDYVQLKVNWETDGQGLGTTENLHHHGSMFGGYLIG